MSKQNKTDPVSHMISYFFIFTINSNVRYRTHSTSGVILGKVNGRNPYSAVPKNGMTLRFVTSGTVSSERCHLS